MQLYDKVAYTLVIPIKPEKKQPFGYVAGPDVGEYEIHKNHLNNHGKVFWSWHFSNAGIKQNFKQYVPDLQRKIGTYQDIDGKLIKINDVGFFYSSEDKALMWKFKATALKETYEIQDYELPYITDARKTHCDNKSTVSWLLISELDKLDTPIKGRLDNNTYYFPEMHFFSNSKGKNIAFNTNHLTSGNAFLIENLY